MASQTLTRSSFLKALATQGPDAGVWNDLDRRYGDWIFGWCRRWGASESDAEDLTQETLVRVYRHIQNYQHNGPCSFRAWIRTVARTTWLMLLRHRSRRPPLVPLQSRFSRSPDDDGVPDDIIQMHDEFSQEAERLEQRELLDVAFNRVRSRTSDSMWRAFELLTLADFSAEDVAEMLGVSRATVYLWNTRVRQKLAEEISTLTNH
jgi:RNA polymerase sigma-70 factor (ECF subfamily)